VGVRAARGAVSVSLGGRRGFGWPPGDPRVEQLPSVAQVFNVARRKRERFLLTNKKSRLSQ